MGGIKNNNDDNDDGASTHRSNEETYWNGKKKMKVEARFVVSASGSNSIADIIYIFFNL